MPRTTDSSRPLPLAVGIDSLYVSFYLDGIGIDWEALALAKERLVHDRQDTFAEIELGGERFALMRGAKRPYSYTLTNRAFSLKLGQRIRPNVHVQFHSEALWQLGLSGTVDRFRSWYRTLGVEPTRPEVVARADFAFDFHLPQRDFGYANFLSRAHKDSEWRAGRQTQTFSFGHDQVVCRVYDKSAEIAEASGKEWFFGIWGQQDDVWRVEFQVRGERLKESGIATLEQLEAHAHALVRDLAANHTTLRRKTRDSNPSRWPLHPVWKSVLASADKLGSGTAPPHVAPCNDAYRRDQQTRAVYGALKGLAATYSALRPEPFTLRAFLQHLPSILQWHHSDDLWEADIRDKLRKMELGL